jgi:hypothetical protein
MQWLWQRVHQSDRGSQRECLCAAVHMKTQNLEHSEGRERGEALLLFSVSCPHSSFALSELAPSLYRSVARNSIQYARPLFSLHVDVNFSNEISFVFCFTLICCFLPSQLLDW